MLERAFRAGVPCSWVTGDSVYGGDYSLRRGIERERRGYVLAVTSAERWPTMPDVPTMAEAGMADFVVTVWAALVAPAQTPRPVVERLNGAMRQIIADPAVQERFLQGGARAVWSTPEETASRAARERPRWQEMVRISGAQAD